MRGSCPELQEVWQILTENLPAVSYNPGSEIFSPTQVLSNFTTPKRLAHEAMVQDTPPDKSHPPNEIESQVSSSLQERHRTSSFSWPHPHLLFSGPKWPPSNAHANIYIRQRTKLVAQEPRRSFFGMGVGEIRTSSQDDAKVVRVRSLEKRLTY
ncbi:Bgt-20060 [Blumeria graminis f. sp. tritici]|uniref:Bgt-20060 n=2 Tax=Blumeria graminis f. sp. tritici TaxID=62690 RepID=A0A9X9QC27_BLUGR|nr:Bgt-20060 [Blumeria graminis f. sp. tritici]